MVDRISAQRIHENRLLYYLFYHLDHPAAQKKSENGFIHREVEKRVSAGDFQFELSTVKSIEHTIEYSIGRQKVYLDVLDRYITQN